MSISGLSSAAFAPACLAASNDVSVPCLLSEGAAMQRLRMQIERLGPHFRTVLVRGEIGTGKELVARALHARGNPVGSPFVICHAARLEEMDEERGGNPISSWMEKAQRGTLFVDGVEEMPPAAQRGLLRALDQRAGTKLIAATSQDLRVMAAAGLFRQDVYHRLAMVEITLEPLRQRTEDIPTLATHFLERFAAQYEKPVRGFTQEAMQRLLAHGWPGNVRELENVLHNGVLQCEDTLLKAADLSSLAGFAGAAKPAGVSQSETTVRLQDVIERHVLRVLRECSGNKVRAAELLGISRSTLYRMLEGCSAQTGGPQVK